MKDVVKEQRRKIAMRFALNSVLLIIISASVGTIFYLGLFA